jgi:putative phage-type endonuclease
MITAEQKIARQGRIGSSDAAAILGLDPYRSAADVWLEKTGQADGFDGNEHTERGNLLEPVLLRWAKGQIAKEEEASDLIPNFESDIAFTHPSGLLIANLDAVMYPNMQADGPVGIIEAKTTVDNEGWGEPGTDQVPDRVNVQVHHQFVCVPSARVAWVPVLLPGFKKFDWRLYRVERNDELCAIVENAGLDFMERFILPRVRPDDYRPSLEVLKRVRREPKKTIPISDELIDNFVVARAARKQAEEACELAQAELLSALGDAEAGEGSALTVTYMQTTRKGYTVAESTYRQLRTKKTGAK